MKYNPGSPVCVTDVQLETQKFQNIAQWFVTGFNNSGKLSWWQWFHQRYSNIERYSTVGFTYGMKLCTLITIICLFHADFWGRRRCVHTDLRPGMKLCNLHQDQSNTQLDDNNLFKPNNTLSHANMLRHLQSILCNLAASVFIVSTNNSDVSVIWLFVVSIVSAVQ